MINFRYTSLSICSLIVYYTSAFAQVQSLSLGESQALAMANYPMVKERNLIAQSSAYSIERANAGYLPQLTINGQATYQSAVTQIPLQLPGMDVPELSKDQYKIYGEVNQLMYDGGVTKLQKEAIDASADIEEQALEVALYQIKERINQLFFGILLLDAQIAQNGLLKRDVQTGLDKINAAIANGMALKSNGSLLEAELLRAQQQAIELQATRSAYLQMLGLFVNRPLGEHTVLETPEAAVSAQEINRPELQWYSQQQRGVEIENRLLTAKNLPKLNLFFQGGAGRPALNMLSNDFEAYYYTGIRLSFPLTGFYTLKKERALLHIKTQRIETKKAAFLFDTSLSLHQQNAEAIKYQQLLKTDDDIIALRTSVKQAALAQLENGVINTAEYMREVNAEDTAKLSKIMHEIQWLAAQYRIKNISGN
ncbi:TolC family protein [Parapedobacter lycopersici]|uniref:TolC family protein n=1 Tax=Parapedobacter lycopersici TaxID=1864939 RepID=UPI00333ED556